MKACWAGLMLGEIGRGVAVLVGAEVAVGTLAACVSCGEIVAVGAAGAHAEMRASKKARTVKRSVVTIQPPARG